VRSKSRTERVLDLHEAGTLEAVSAYVMHERPHDTTAGSVLMRPVVAVAPDASLGLP
jgi:hypothetical protein